MKKEKNNFLGEEYFKDLRIDCNKCFGLCCVSLYFSKVEGFPNNKKSKVPCMYLLDDFKCSDHNNLFKNGLKGCTSYDCFGAGQKISQITFKGESWRDCDDNKQEMMFEGFVIMKQLHEMLWYLASSKTFRLPKEVFYEVKTKYYEVDRLTRYSVEEILKIDINEQRAKVNEILKKVNEHIKANELNNKDKNIVGKKKLSIGYDYIGKNLERLDLVGESLAGALLIASSLRNNNLNGTNLIGADMRDADIRGADLRKAIFLTQGQINSAKGNSKTLLPKHIEKPLHWEKLN